MNQVLGRFVKNAHPEKMTALYQKAPVILLKSISQDAGQKIADMLTNVGASVSFVPEPAPKPQADVIIEHHVPTERTLSPAVSQIETADRNLVISDAFTTRT